MNNKELRTIEAKLNFLKLLETELNMRVNYKNKICVDSIDKIKAAELQKIYNIQYRNRSNKSIDENPLQYLYNIYKKIKPGYVKRIKHRYYIINNF